MVGRKIVPQVRTVFGSLDGAIAAFRKSGGKGKDGLGMMILGLRSSEEASFHTFDLWSASLREFGVKESKSYPILLEIARAQGFETLTLEEALTGAVMCSRLERMRWRCAAVPAPLYQHMFIPEIHFESDGSMLLSGETHVGCGDDWFVDRTFVWKRPTGK